MSTIHQAGSQQSGIALPRDAANGVRPGEGQTPDFDFWRRVFDDARGTGLDAGTKALEQGERPADTAMATVDRAVPPEQARARALADATDSPSRAAQAPGTFPEWQGGRAVADGQMPSALITIGGRVFPATPSMLDGAAQAADGPPDAHPVLRAAQAEGPGSPAEQVPTGLQAHIVQTASGGWKVALRSGHPLSVAQALAAVAQAIGQPGMPRGQIEQVLLNGRPIYQQTRLAHGGAGIVFELHC